MRAPHSLCSQPRSALLPGLLVTAVLLGLVFGSGCSKRWLEGPMVAPDAEIRNTEQARELVAMMEDYQEALTRRNVNAIRAMVSRDYFENAGTTDTSEDDYGLDGLLEVLDLLAEHVRELRVEIQVRDLHVDERRNRAHVVYEFAYTLLYRIDNQDMWDTARDINRMDFALEDGVWRITGGL